MMKGNSLKKMVSKIMALVAHILPPAPKPRTEEIDETLIVNERLAVACQITEDAEGYFSVFRFDQLTNIELPHENQRFPDRDMAIAAAWKLAYFDNSVTPDQLHQEQQQRAHNSREESVLA